MDINVKVTIGLAQHVQDLAQALIETITSRPTELPARSTVSNDKPTVAEARTTEVVTQQPVEHEQPVEQEQPQEQTDVVSIEQVREKVAEAVTQGKRAQVVAILQEFGATGFSQLKGEELNEFYKKIKEL